MDLIKEWNGFVYGCISLGVACGVGGVARRGGSGRLRLLGSWRARARGGAFWNCVSESESELGCLL